MRATMLSLDPHKSCPESRHLSLEAAKQQPHGGFHQRCLTSLVESCPYLLPFQKSFISISAVRSIGGLPVIGSMGGCSSFPRTPAELVRSKAAGAAGDADG